MKILRPERLAEYRAKRVCEACGRVLRYPAHPHHLFTRGSGQLDININLIALGCAWDCNCHGKHHDGNDPDFNKLIEIIARREGTDPVEIDLEIFRLRRLDKDADPGPILGESQDREAGRGPAHDPRPPERPDGRVSGGDAGPSPGDRQPGVPAEEGRWHQL